MRRRQREDMWSLLSKVDAHSERTAEDIYCCRTADDDVQLAELLYRSVWGSPVEWPKDRALQDNDKEDLDSRIDLYKITEDNSDKIAIHDWAELDRIDNLVAPTVDNEFNAQMHEKMLTLWPKSAKDAADAIAAIPIGDGSADGVTYPALNDMLPDAAEDAEHQLVLSMPGSVPLSGPLPDASPPKPPTLRPTAKANNATMDTMDTPNQANQRHSNQPAIDALFGVSRSAPRGSYDNYEDWLMDAARSAGFTEKAPDREGIDRILARNPKPWPIDFAFNSDGLRSWYRRKMPQGDFNPQILQAQEGRQSAPSRMQRDDATGDVCVGRACQDRSQEQPDEPTFLRCVGRYSFFFLSRPLILVCWVTRLKPHRVAEPGGTPREYVVTF